MRSALLQDLGASPKLSGLQGHYNMLLSPFDLQACRMTAELALPHCNPQARPPPAGVSNRCLCSWRNDNNQASASWQDNDNFFMLGCLLVKLGPSHACCLTACGGPWLLILGIKHGTDVTAMLALLTLSYIMPTLLLDYSRP